MGEGVRRYVGIYDYYVCIEKFTTKCWWISVFCVATYMPDCLSSLSVSLQIYVQSSVAWIESMVSFDIQPIHSSIALADTSYYNIFVTYYIKQVLSPIFTENGNKMLLMDSVPVRDDSFLHIIEIDTSVRSQFSLN